MRITKTMAENVATKMTAKRSEEIKSIDLEATNLVTEAYKDFLPTFIMRASKDYPEFMNVGDRISLVGNGFNFDWVNLSEDLPLTRHNRFELPADVAGKVIELRNISKTKSRENNLLKREITTALVNLRTLAKVTEHFPEALPYIDASPNAQIAVDLSSLRKKL